MTKPIIPQKTPDPRKPSGLYNVKEVTVSRPVARRIPYARFGRECGENILIYPVTLATRAARAVGRRADRVAAAAPGLVQPPFGRLSPRRPARLSWRPIAAPSWLTAGLSAGAAAGRTALAVGFFFCKVVGLLLVLPVALAILPLLALHVVLSLLGRLIGRVVGDVADWVLPPRMEDVVEVVVASLNLDEPLYNTGSRWDPSRR